MESCLPGCKTNHLAFQNIPLWISLLVMLGFIEMEIMGTPVGRGKPVNVLNPAILAEMGQLSCCFPQPPTSSNKVYLLFQAFYQNRHVCCCSESCHVEGTDAFALNVKEFPSILSDSGSPKIHAGKGCFSALLPPLHKSTLALHLKSLGNHQLPKAAQIEGGTWISHSKSTAPWYSCSCSNCLWQEYLGKIPWSWFRMFASFWTQICSEKTNNSIWLHS